MATVNEYIAYLRDIPSLTPKYSDAPTFSEWVVRGGPSADYWMRLDGDGWNIYVTNEPYPEGLKVTIVGKGNALSTRLSWTEQEASASFTATRVRTDISYILGPDDQSNPNRDKPLASEAGAEALRTGKADRAANPTPGNLAALTQDGNLTDSGKKPADFATAEQGVKADTAVQPEDLPEDLPNPQALKFVTTEVGLYDGYDGSEEKTLSHATNTRFGLVRLSDRTDWDRSATNGAFAATPAAVKTVNDRVTTVEGKIPAQVSAQNPLVDTQTMNSSIATNTANYISDDGKPFTSLAALQAYSGPLTNNDYAFVVGTDAAGNTTYTRYKYNENATPPTWAEEFVLNNSSFTAAQWAAISSGITSGLVAKLGDLPTAQALSEALAGKLDKSGGTMTGALTIGENGSSGYHYLRLLGGGCAIFVGGETDSNGNLQHGISVDFQSGGNYIPISVYKNGSFRVFNLPFAAGTSARLENIASDFSASVSYVYNALVLYASGGDSLKLYRCVNPSGHTGNWNPNDFQEATVEDILAALRTGKADKSDIPVLIFSPSASYAANVLVVYSGALYKFTAAHPAGAWIGTDATKIVELADIASATALTAEVSRAQAAETLATRGFTAWELDYSDANTPGPIDKIAWNGLVWTAALQCVCGMSKSGLASYTTVTWVPGEWGSIGTTSELVGTWTGDHWEPSITEYDGYPLVILGSRDNATPAQEMIDGVAGTGGSDPNALELRIDVANTWPNGGGSGTVIATRTALQGYQLGSQTDKPLASADAVDARLNGDKVILGNGATAAGEDGVSVGRLAKASAQQSIAIGKSANASSSAAVAIGNGAKASYTGAIQLGNGHNTRVNSLKFRGTMVVDSDGKIPDASIADTIARKSEVVKTPTYDGQNHQFLSATEITSGDDWTAVTSNNAAHAWTATTKCIAYLTMHGGSGGTVYVKVNVNIEPDSDPNNTATIFKPDNLTGRMVCFPVFLNTEDTLYLKVANAALNSVTLAVFNIP